MSASLPQSLWFLDIVSNYMLDFGNVSCTTRTPNLFLDQFGPLNTWKGPSSKTLVGLLV